MNRLFSEVFFNQAIRYVIKKNLSGVISQDELNLSLYKHKYHHWTNVNDMINRGFVELLIDKLKHKEYSKYIRFSNIEASLVCEKVNNITQFKKIFELKYEIFNDKSLASKIDFVYNAILGGSLEIVKMLLPQSITKDQFSEFMKLALVRRNFDIFECLHQTYNKKYNLDIYKWLDVFNSKSISSYFWVGLWIGDTSPDHTRFRNIFKNNNNDGCISDAEEDVKSYLKKAIVNLDKPYWYSFLELGDPSLYFSCKESLKEGSAWGSNFFNSNFLLNPSFSDRLRMELMLTVYIYERYHNEEKTMESALLEVVNGIRKRHPHCQIDDHATGFEEHVFLLLVLSCSKLRYYFSHLKSNLISAEFNLTNPTSLSEVKRLLEDTFYCSRLDMCILLLTEYPNLVNNSIGDMLFSSNVQSTDLMKHILKGDVFNDHIKAILSEILDWRIKNFNIFQLIELPVNCKTPQALQFVFENYKQFTSAMVKVEISDESLQYLLHPMFDNILEEYPHSVLFKLLGLKSIVNTDRMTDFRVISIVSSLLISMKMEIGYTNYVSFKQFLHFNELIELYEIAPDSHIEFHLVGSIASYEIYKKLKDAASNNKIILSDDWEKQVYESAIKCVEFSPLHKEFILKMNYTPIPESSSRFLNGYF